MLVVFCCEGVKFFFLNYFVNESRKVAETQSFFTMNNRIGLKPIVMTYILPPVKTGGN